MKSVIKKWGNSYAIRIPKELMDSCALREDSVVYMESSGTTLLIKKKETLHDLIKDMKPYGEEIDWGEVRGKEFW